MCITPTKKKKKFHQNISAKSSLPLNSEREHKPHLDSTWLFPNSKWDELQGKVCTLVAQGVTAWPRPKPNYSDSNVHLQWSQALFNIPLLASF